ncbi:MAG: hypothetical protein MJ114_03165 [Acetatifactor sp.]|nr:hypothetical protein [Acetatifactor sp.]
MREYTCFVISPIGQEGTELYEEYKDLLELIIVPALEIYNIKVRRGDHFINDDKIDSSVIKNIQDADICICDISLPNPNVYYELGRRDETGKPVLLLKKKGTPQCPVDIATRRFFEYEWEGRYAIREAQNHIRSFVEPLIDQGFEEKGKSATLSDIADSISRLERKIDRLGTAAPAAGSVLGGVPLGDAAKATSDADPNDKLSLALMQKNIPLAEEAMAQLQVRMDKLKFMDTVVRKVAQLGSEPAGKLMIASADEYFDSSVSLTAKLNFLGSMVTYATKKAKTEEFLTLFHRVCKSLELQAENERPEAVQTIYNQQNRLYYSFYLDTRNIEWLEKAITALKKAIQIAPENFLYYNLCTCYYSYSKNTGNMDMMELAREAIDACLAKDTKDDKDHVEYACRIYSALKDPRLGDMFEKLRAINPIRAQVIAKDILGNQ